MNLGSNEYHTDGFINFIVWTNSKSTVSLGGEIRDNWTYCAAQHDKYRVLKSALTALIRLRLGTIYTAEHTRLVSCVECTHVNDTEGDIGVEPERFHTGYVCCESLLNRVYTGPPRGIV